MTNSHTDLFGIASASAVLSPCGQYRYELHRRWTDGPVCGWIMCNPSTADARVDDPTIRRCIRFARRWGYAGIVVRNIYALRSTDPAALHRHPDPFGPDNGEYLARAADDPITICAWGNHAAQWGDRFLTTPTGTGAWMHFLARNTQGVPKHPLYLPGRLTPIPFAATGHPEGTSACSP